MPYRWCSEITNIELSSMEQRIDWHVHTLEGSNESIPAKDVVSKAVSKKLYALPITDHNSTKAIPLAMAYAGNNINIVPGLELDALVEGARGHILCFYPDFGKYDFQRELEIFISRRAQRIFDCAYKFEEKNLLSHSETERVIEELKNMNGSLPRIVIADVLIKLYGESDNKIGRRVRSFSETGSKLAFKVLDEFLEKKSAPEVNCYVGYHPKYTVDYTEVIDFCIKNNGVCGFAHITKDIKDTDIVKRAFCKGLEQGMMFLCIKHPDHSEKDARFLENLADSARVNFKGITGPVVKLNGTDYHGEPGKPELGDIFSAPETLEQVQDYAIRLRHIKSL
jgi:DNA-directed RNA polymerase subunit H (RpoH/RPB5)